MCLHRAGRRRRGVQRGRRGRSSHRLETSLRRAQERGKLDDADEVIDRVAVVPDLARLADRELVVEAIVVDKCAKVALFRRLDEVVTSPDAMLGQLRAQPHDQVDNLRGFAFGLEAGRRERGSKTASPSRRYRATSS